MSDLTSLNLTRDQLSYLLGLKNQSMDLRNQTMALKGQADADRLNVMMLNYTRESVDDNTTVKLITVFSLVYLPGSFIAVSTCGYLLLFIRADILSRCSV